ncbi:glutamate receptor ionotropic, kainate 2-like [Orbicella faveolata]|uniref:glutamate receptor ionotropic, kainate 2-like n=1 Tax=Orbicella faveolata TaxID=48498 RepID=UPI0009E41A93|nr:glutamate receptor ionotropic, kainate 2-like [Orbicella faveolata]
MANQRPLLVLTLLLYPLQSASVNYVKIGGILCDELNSNELSAFNLGLEYVNNDATLLPNTVLVPLINKTDWTDAFSNIDAAYWQIRGGAVAIVGPTTSSSVKATHALCAGFHIPQIAPYATDPSFDFSADSYSYLVRMSSSDATENRALADFVSHFNWTRIAVLTSRSDFGLNGLVVFKDIASHKGWTLVAVESFQEFRIVSKINAMTQLLHIRSRGARIVVLNCMAGSIRTILRQASDLGMVEGWVWLVTNGAFAFDGLYEQGQPIPEYLQGIVGIRHSFGGGTEYQNFENTWKKKGYEAAPLEKDATVGHTFDSVLVLATAIHNMIQDGYNVTITEGLEFGVLKNGSTAFSKIGETLLDYITKVNTSGVMDTIVFDTNRSPLSATFDIVNLRRSGLEKVGKWDSINGLVMEEKKEIIWPSEKTSIPSDTSVSMENQTFTIVTIEETPFITKQSSSIKSDKLVLMGYCIDLLEKLQEKLKFSYEVYLVPDGNYGSQDALTKEWNGIVKEIIEERADMAVASFTISSERQKVIDFTQPFMHLGLTALVRSVNDEVDFFAFFKPFKVDLWITIAVTTFLIGVLLWFFGTFSPFGFYGRCVQISHYNAPREHQKRRHTLRLTKSLCSSLVHYVGQSADSLHPVSASGRITVAVWWFAILIIISTYTANLAAFLTIKRLSSPINSIEDLAGQTSTPYGTVANSQPQSFFETSSIPSFVTMWRYMKYHHTLLKNSQVGIKRVKQGNFALIGDSVVLEHTTHTVECGTLTTIGSLFGEMGYGIGLPKDSPYTKQLSQAILELGHEGYMDSLEQKWFHSQRHCEEEHVSDDRGIQLGLADMVGVFIIVCVGVGISFIVLLIECSVASCLTTKEDDPDAPRTAWNSLDARRGSTWHDWRHRDDVPEMPRFISGLTPNDMGRFMAFLARQRRRRTVSSEMNPEVELELESLESFN